MWVFETNKKMYVWAVWWTCFEDKVLAPMARKVSLLVFGQLQVSWPMVLFPETLRLPREVEKMSTKGWAGVGGAHKKKYYGNKIQPFQSQTHRPSHLHAVVNGVLLHGAAIRIFVHVLVIWIDRRFWRSLCWSGRHTLNQFLPKKNLWITALWGTFQFYNIFTTKSLVSLVSSSLLSMASKRFSDIG